MPHTCELGRSTNISGRVLSKALASGVVSIKMCARHKQTARMSSGNYGNYRQQEHKRRNEEEEEEDFAEDSEEGDEEEEEEEAEAEAA